MQCLLLQDDIGGQSRPSHLGSFNRLARNFPGDLPGGTCDNRARQLQV